MKYFVEYVNFSSMKREVSKEFDTKAEAIAYRNSVEPIYEAECDRYGEAYALTIREC